MMIGKTIKYIARTFLFILGALVLLFIYFNWPIEKKSDNVSLGITFSHRYASDIGLNWKETYQAMLDDLGARRIRIPVYWDLVEKEEGQMDFTDIDYQLEEAQKREAEIILVVGQKVPRWPECAIPAWANINDAKRKDALLRFEEVVINRYKSHPSVKYWQIENEPFLLFGICPKPDAKLLDNEIALAKKIDSTRPIIVTDSGELSFWVPAAARADIFGTTMYRNVYKEGFGYYKYPLGPRFFRFKYGLIKLFANQDKAIVAELQAEPWISGYTTNQPLEEQFKSMTAEKLRENVDYAEKVGFPEVYLWGVEWWYWLKVEKNHSEVWETAKVLFNTH